MVDRAYIRELRENEKRFLAPDLMSASAEVKTGLLFLPSMVGLYTTGRQSPFKGRLTEKMIIESFLPDILENSDLSIYERLFNYINLAYNTKEPIERYGDNLHIASIIYGIVHYLFAEDVYDLKGVEFRKFLPELKERPTSEEIRAYYRGRIDRNDPIRDSMLTFDIRNPELKILEEKKKMVIYSCDDYLTGKK